MKLKLINCLRLFVVVGLFFGYSLAFAQSTDNNLDGFTEVNPGNAFNPGITPQPISTTTASTSIDNTINADMGGIGGMLIPNIFFPLNNVSNNQNSVGLVVQTACQNGVCSERVIPMNTSVVPFMHTTNNLFTVSNTGGNVLGMSAIQAKVAAHSAMLNEFFSGLAQILDINNF